MTLDHRFLMEITPQDLVITANRRLATHLLHQFEQAHCGQNKAWLTPAILPLSNWLSNLWAHLRRPQLLLDSVTRLWIWQGILKEFTNDAPLLDYQRAAELAQEAWQYTHQWRIPYAILESSEYEEVKVFLQWAREFQKRCEENNWCDETLLPELLLNALPSLRDQCPQRLYLVGFDTVPPSVQILLDALSSTTKIIIPQQPISQATTKKIVLNDRKTEFHLLAQWAKKNWLENPQLQCGCIVPELLSDRINVERAFFEEFKHDFNKAVNISGGDSLLSFSMVQTLITLLELVSGQSLQLSKLTPLLLSPYLHGAIEERDQRAILDRELRSFHHEGFKLTELVGLLQKTTSCPKLFSLFNVEYLRDNSRHRFPSEWAKVIKNTLTHFGWPGERNLSSIEYQCVNSFQQKLQYYAGLDGILNTHSFQQAIDVLRDLLSKTLFQGQSDHHAPIQVLGLLEASGLFFDKVWITSMNDDTWPRPSSPNPFLPVQLQRKVGVPRSSSTHELEYAQRIMQRLSHSTSHLIASYSLQKTEEQRELSPSPLILNFTETSLTQLQLELPTLPTVKALLENWVDDIAPPLQDSEKIRGGATILQRQAECPFRAFAEIRLKAQPFEEVELGLSPAERGSLVHEVMAEIWRELGNSTELQHISQENLNGLIQKIVSNIVNELSTPLRDLEMTRLTKLVQQWLTLEKSRSDFIVTAIEEPFSFSIGKLNLRLQVDRIDTLKDGSHIIIDYKTGSPSPQSWFGERPDEPQLPLYALHDSERIRGLAFAQIRVQSVKFNGITAEAGQLPNIKASPIPWEKLLNEWEINLTALANDFAMGKAVVDPKKYPTTCLYCHLASVCRINEKVSE
ncbi:MAG: PD-(D/E)XK nuclease family protein [Gammaproteobacteria bacterium]|nr:PD-(D/E)XK nuclease family protein [Gammaproteobacteria bacterium]